MISMNLFYFKRESFVLNKKIIAQALLHALTMSVNAGLREAPPTRNPSMSALPINSAAFFSVTDPP